MISSNKALRQFKWCSESFLPRLGVLPSLGDLQVQTKESVYLTTRNFAKILLKGSPPKTRRCNRRVRGGLRPFLVELISCQAAQIAVQGDQD